MKTRRSNIDYFCPESLRADLKQKTVRGGMVTGVAQASQILIGLATVPILTRLLDPADFGLVAMVTVFTGFAAMFVDAGMSTATVQREEITHQQVSNLFWIAMLLGMGIAALTIALAPIISWLYGEPRLVWITIALAVSFIFSGLTVQHQALLRRGMQFNALAAAGLTAFVVGQGTGIVWAWNFRNTDWDYWALVIAPVVTAMVRMAATWGACAWRPSRPRRHSGTRVLAEFGANLTMFSFVNYFARNGDNLMIGIFWGAVPLGFYERAYRVLLMPMQQIAPPFSAVIVPALSRLYHSPDRYKHAYLSAVRTLAWASIPLIGLLACTAEPLILLYMGPKWGPVVPLLLALLPAAWANCFIISSGWVFTSSGRVRPLLIWGVVHSAIVILVIAACVPFGTLAVACGVSAAYVVLRVPGFLYCFQGTSLRLRDLGAVIWRPTLTAACAAAIAWIVDTNWLPPQSNAVQFSIVAAIYAATFLAIALIIPTMRDDLAHLREITRISNRKAEGA